MDSERDTVIDQLQHATGRNTIAAAEPGQAAYEGYRDHGVLTYAFLEALNKDEGLPDDFVDLLTVAAHLSRRVPEISAATFGVRQRPKTDLKDNFPLGVRKPVLRTAALFCQSPQPGQEANYFAAFDLKLHQGPSDTAPVIIELKRNSLVTLKACEGAWALIERGAKMGMLLIVLLNL